MRKQSVYMYASAHFDFALPSQMKDYLAERSVFANQDAVDSFAQLLPQAVALADKELCLQPEERLSWVLQKNKPNLIVETINSDMSRQTIEPGSIVTGIAAQATLATDVAAAAVVISMSENAENEMCEIVDTNNNALDEKIEQSGSCAAVNLEVSESLEYQGAGSAADSSSNEDTEFVGTQIEDSPIEQYGECETHVEVRLYERETVEVEPASQSAADSGEEDEDDDKARESAFINDATDDCNRNSADAELPSNIPEDGSEPVLHVFADIKVCMYLLSPLR
jgi:hypothetical protein